MKIRFLKIWLVVLVNFFAQLGNAFVQVYETRNYLECHTHKKSPKEGTYYRIKIKSEKKPHCRETLVAMVEKRQASYFSFIGEYTVYSYLAEEGSLENIYGEGFNLLFRKQTLKPSESGPGTFKVRLSQGGVVQDSELFCQKK